jgi:hypothetical protein
MPATAGVQHVVDTIDEATRLGTDAALRMGGALMAPQVHVLLEHVAEPYFGYLSCRPLYRGGDVVDAMGVMGVIGSLLDASRLLVVWEHQDLCTALELPGAESEPYGHVMVDAERAGRHVLRWRPFRLHVELPTSVGLPAVVPEWGEPVRHPDVELPTPVAALLAVWREPRVWTSSERVNAFAHLEEAGYRMRWVSRSGDESAAAAS